MFKHYLLAKHSETLINILKEPERNKHYALPISFPELVVADPLLGNRLLSEPEETLKIYDSILEEVQTFLIQNSNDNKNSEPLLKSNIHIRIHNLLPCPELVRKLFPRNEDIGLFLQVSGTITRVGLKKMLERKRMYICKKCKYKQCIEADYDLHYVLQPPNSCSNPEKCKGSNFQRISNLGSEYCADYQEIKIQEETSKLDMGTMPNTISITLEDDLVDVCKPGDSITVCGSIRRRWMPLIPGKKIDVECVIKANHIKINNDTKSGINISSAITEEFDYYWDKYAENPLYGRDLILRSFCPQIYGMYLVKLAIAVVLAGGSSFKKNETTGLRARTEPHLLLIGDPGTGKSQLLKFSSKVIARSVLTTGVGSSSAGLTVAATMEDGEWSLEGGALVQADGGICCIDEFNTMKPQDKMSIHEAMEEQTISIAKAGIVSKFNTRCSILAATNPVVRGSKNEYTSMNTGLSSPLLSRFDLILELKDNFDPNLNEELLDYIQRGYKHKSKFFENKNNSWPLHKLQAYFTVIKKRTPKLTEEAHKIFSTYYQLQRQFKSRNISRTTVRLLDSLVRLSTAHAKLMFHDSTEVMDAIFAIILIEMQGDLSPLELEFDAFSLYPDKPMESYCQLRDCILQKLNLLDLRNISNISRLNALKIGDTGLKAAEISDLNTSKRHKDKYVTITNVRLTELDESNKRNFLDEDENCKKLKSLNDESSLSNYSINKEGDRSRLNTLKGGDIGLKAAEMSDLNTSKRYKDKNVLITNVKITELNVSNKRNILDEDESCKKLKSTNDASLLSNYSINKEVDSSVIKVQSLKITEKSNTSDSGNFSQHFNSFFMFGEENDLDDIDLDI